MLRALVLFLFATQVSATTLVNRYQYINARVLPAGVWTFAVNRGQSLGKMRNSYGPGGQSVSNSDFFSRDVSYSNLVDEVVDPLEKELAAAAFEVYGLEQGEKAGQVVNRVEVEQQSDVYVLGRGLSSKSSLFLVFPVVNLKTRFRSRFELSSSLQSFAQKLKAEGQYQRASEILEKSQSALETGLSDNGYQQSYPSEVTTLANVFVNHRYQALKERNMDLSLDSILVVPAGTKSDEDDFLPLRFNEEQYGYKQGLTASWAPASRLELLSSVYYHKRFGFKKRQRIPRNTNSPLSNDIENVSLKYGDSYGTSAQMNLVLSDTYLLYLGQALEFRDRDQVSGSRFEDRRYRYMEEDTDQRLGTAYVGVAVNTITHFLAKRFPIPVDVNLQYSATNFGKNAFNYQALGLNLMVFYK